jgi:endonuclease YncB( thermonuclease family)
MSRKVSSATANFVLAAGVTLAVAIAIAFVLTGQQHAPPRLAAVSTPAIDRTSAPSSGAGAPLVARTLPPPHARKSAPTGSGSDSVRRVAGLPTATAVPTSVQPYQPPVPMAMVEVTRPASPAPPTAPRPSAAMLSEVAALPGSGFEPPSLALDVRQIHRMPARGRARHAAPGLAAKKPAAPKPADAATGPLRNTAYRPLGSEAGPRIGGPAVVTSALELNVAGRPLRLYGVAAPKASDLCAWRAAYAAQQCDEASREALAHFVADNGAVSCRMLAVGAGERMALPALCTTANGRDLGRYLVANGFALADPNEIVDYAAAEKKARHDQLGLWGYR